MSSNVCTKLKDCTAGSHYGDCGSMPSVPNHNPAEITDFLQRFSGTRLNDIDAIRKLSVEAVAMLRRAGVDSTGTPADDAEKQAREIVEQWQHDSEPPPIGVNTEQELIEGIAATLRSRPVGECAWTFDPDGYWKTSCGDQFQISDGTPAENNMRFCHYCGLRITEKSK